jgi:peptidoglycan/LPS O-acetylase OafA/YrhL
MRSTCSKRQVMTIIMQRHADTPVRSTGYLSALDGLRFTAAIMVAAGHYTRLGDGPPLSEAIATLTGLGMTLFFVLSGFVIHYNYGAAISREGGIRSFIVARFARLYPLFIIMFLVDFAYTGFTAHSACGRAGASGAQLFAFVNYLTLTQSWFYGVICNASLIYQYGPVSAVTWSISVEIFFYLFYVALGVLMGRRKWPSGYLLGMAPFAYGLVIIYFLLCEHFLPYVDHVGITAFGPIASIEAGYQDSFLRWLLYFNPAARLGEFLAGVAAAQLLLNRRDHARRLSPSWANASTLISIVAVVVVHFWLYSVVASAHGSVGRIASPLYAPVIASMMYLVARYDTLCSRLLSQSTLVKLGEASYSIYLLHETMPSVCGRLGLMTSDTRLKWILWLAALVLLMIVSRASYLLVERPMRARIRKLFAQQRAAKATS